MTPRRPPSPLCSLRYALLDAKELELGALGGRAGERLRLLCLKNPWAKRRWTGPFSVDDARWKASPALRAAANGYDPDAARRSDDGVFWIDWQSALRYFGHVSLNWNPALFAHASVRHEHWPSAAGPRNDSFNLGLNPQFTLALARAAPGAKPPTVWALLTRHSTRGRSAAAAPARADAARATAAAPDASDFLTLHVYDRRGGARVFTPEKPLYWGTYSNSPTTLVRIDLEPAPAAPAAPAASAASAAPPRACTLVVSQYDKKADVDFSLAVFCTAAFALRRAPAPPAHRAVLRGAWDASSAGGPPAGRGGAFARNPQFSLVVDTACRAHLELQAPKELAVGLTLVGPGGRGGARIDCVLVDEQVVSSGAFRRGFTFAEAAELAAGVYTLVPSTFEPGQCGAFVLTVCTSAPLRAARPIG